MIGGKVKLAHVKVHRKTGKGGIEKKRGEEIRWEDTGMYIFLRIYFQISLNFHFLYKYT